MKGEARYKTAQGLDNSSEEKESLYIENGLSNVDKMGIFYINKGQAHCIHDPVHSDKYCRDDTGGSILRTLVKAFSKGRGQKYISVCQSYFLLGGGGLSDRETISCLLTVPWKIPVQEMRISILLGSSYYHLEWKMMVWTMLRDPSDHQKLEGSRMQAMYAK